MIATLLEPFGYSYMVNAIWVSGLVGCVCGFLSAYLMLKGWSLIGDALSHAIVPGVAGAYMLGLPFAAGAFLSGGLAAGAMLFLNRRTKLKEDAIIGMIFTSFFGIGLFMVSLSPTSVNIQTIVLGNILAITPEDTVQLAIIGGVTLVVLLLKWKDLMVTFFDENHARSIGLNPTALRILFFTLLSASTVAALQTVGAFLVVAMVVTPGATAYLLTDRFQRLILLAAAIGAGTSLVGAYLSYFLDGATGGIIVVLQTAIFLTAFLSGGLAASAMLFLNQRTKLREDAIIGLIFTSFFGLGLFMISLSPASVNIQTIVLGNILAVSPADTLQLVIIGGVSLAILLVKWKDLMVAFFDENHARSIGLNPDRLKVLFFTLLAASTVAALQTVGAFLVIAMVVTPGATAYLLTDRFPRLILIAVAVGALSSLVGAYISFFLDGATGGVIVVLQTAVFLTAFFFAPKHGLLAARRKAAAEIAS